MLLLEDGDFMLFALIVFDLDRSMFAWEAAAMSNESQGLVKAEAALMQSPSVSASAQALPLSPSTSKTAELPGTVFILALWKFFSTLRFFFI